MQEIVGENDKRKKNKGGRRERGTRRKENGMIRRFLLAYLSQAASSPLQLPFEVIFELVKMVWPFHYDCDLPSWSHGDPR